VPSPPSGEKPRCRSIKFNMPCVRRGDYAGTRALTALELDLGPTDCGQPDTA
jgi:hypothetical protein